MSLFLRSWSDGRPRPSSREATEPPQFLHLSCMLAKQVSTTSNRVGLHFHPPVARIALHNPPLNIIDIPMMEQLSAGIAEAEARSDISVMVLAGSDKVFSAGVDVAAHTPDKVQQMLSKFHDVFRAWITSR